MILVDLRPGPFDRQVPLDPALEGGVKGHNIKENYLTGKSRPLGRGTSPVCTGIQPSRY